MEIIAGSSEVVQSGLDLADVYQQLFRMRHLAPEAP